MVKKITCRSNHCKWKVNGECTYDGELNFFMWDKFWNVLICTAYQKVDGVEYPKE